MSHTQNLVVFSDTHAGCRVGLCPPGEVRLDDGGFYRASELQLVMWRWWEEFWRWVSEVTHGEPYDAVNNGDAINGIPHGAVGLISHNLLDQRRLAETVLRPVVDRCLKLGGTYYHIRGTEAHVGKSGQDEEQLARDLGAKPNAEGQHARYELWKRVGHGLVHLLHHVGTTGSRHYEATGVHKELIEAYTEAAIQGVRPPDVIVRSHRHRCIWTGIPTELHEGVEDAVAIVTPGWQARTPFAWKIPGGRQSAPQFGGIVIRQHPEGVLYVRKFVRHLSRSPAE